LTLVCLRGVVCFGVLVSRRKNRVIREGEHTMPWLVHANENLTQEGFLDGSALVVISPEVRSASDERWLADLADRVAVLRGRQPGECGSADKATVAELLRDESYVEGKRDRLPDLFAHGREAYLARLFVYRYHLPARRLDGPRIACAVMWHEPNSLICTRP